jgi:hypothetical protein
MILDEYAKTIVEERQSKLDPLMKTHNPKGYEAPTDAEEGFFGVASDAIHSLKWTAGDLIVMFRNKKKYVYHEVPENVYDVLRTSTSVGRAFHKLVTCNGYKFEKV